MSSRAVWLILLAALLAGCNLNNNPGGVLGSVSGAPVVQITAPQPNATYLQGVAVNIQASITNAGRDIDRVEIVIDGEIAATLDQPNQAGDPAFNVTHGWSASGVGTHTIGVTAFRADGSASAPTSVTITVTDSTGASQSNTQPTLQLNSTVTLGLVQPTAQRTTAAPANNTATRQPTQQTANTAAPTAASSGSGSGTAMATFNQGTNVRRGPGLEFEPPIGAYPAGQEVEILAVNPNGTWYKVRYGGGEGWVFAQLVSTSGNTAALPRDPGPPVPTARPAPVVPPTSAAPPTTQPQPSSGVNLVAGIVELNPGSPRCAETFNVGFDVANLGSQASVSGTVSLVDVRAADGSTQQSTIGGFPALQPGQTFRVDMPLTVSTWYNEDHRLILVIDPNNQIPETEEGDNRREITYSLPQGNCG